MSNDLTDVCNIEVGLSYNVTDKDEDNLSFIIDNEDGKLAFKVEIGGENGQAVVIFYKKDVHKLAEFFTKSLEAIGIARSEKKK